MKTKVEERIRIRDRSGRIKGPFSRKEVVALIQKKKLEGEEEIFLESEGRWRPIGSDTEFFDLIQEIYFGIKAGTNVSYKAPESKGGWRTGSFEKEAYPKVDETERLPGTENRSTHTHTTQILGSRVGDEIKKEATFKKQTREEPKVPSFSDTAKAAPPLEVQKTVPNVLQGFEDLAPKEEKKPKKFRGAFVVLLVLLAALWGASQYLDQQKEVQDLSKISLDYTFTKGYFRPLLLRLRLMPALTHPPLKLSADFDSLKYLPINVHDLLLQVDEKERDANSLSSGSAWVLKIWSLKVVGDALSVAYPAKGAELKNAANILFDDLQRNVKVGEDIKQLFASLDAFLAGDLLKSLSIAQAAPQTLPIKLFEREVSSWAELMPEYDGKVKASAPIADDDLSDTPINVQYEEGLRLSVDKDTFAPNFLKRAEVLLSFDSHSLLAWHFLGRYNFLNFKANPQVAYRYYFTGLVELSLYPKVLQVFYWKDFAQFNKVSGALDPTKIFETADLIQRGNVDGDPKMLDIDDPFFHYSALLDTYKKAFESNEMNNIELASYEILSEASPNARENLISVTMSPLLDRQWSMADRHLRLLEKTFPFDLEVKTLRVWFEGERFRFEKAEEVLAKSFGAVGAKGNNSEQIKAEGILHILGRDYDKGIELLKSFLQNNQQDALSQYFIGRASFEAEKYVECVRYSQLAQLNSLGPLKLRSEILNYRCRVRANLGSEAALREFGQFVTRFPETAIAREEYVRALMDADRTQEAEKIAEDAVRENPQSANLKILLGEVYEHRGQPNEALLMYNEAHKLDSLRSRAAVHVGDLMMKENRFAEAAQSYIDAGAQDLESPELFLKAARAFRQAGMVDKAREMYFKEVELRPAVLETFLEAAEFLLEKNLPNQVPELFKRFSEDFKSDARVLTRLAQAYVAMGDNKNAQSNAELAVRLSPTEAEPYRILATVFEAQGQYPLSKANYEKYLVLIPEAPDAQSIKQKIALPPFTTP